MNVPLREAMLYEKLPEKKVQCNICGRRCKVPEGKVGYCRVKRNDGGKLYSLVYSKICSAHVDPIGKKPLSHFNPGSLVMSIATIGCNFRCQFCDNWMISQENKVKGSNLPSERVVKAAKNNECQGISYTYTEPTIFFEYAYDTARIAHDQGLFNTFVTNGYMTPEAIQTIAPYLDAATVDFKGGGRPEFYKKFSAVPSVEPIYNSLKEMKKLNIHVEITNLVVPKIGDSMDDIHELALWVKDKLGSNTPFHLLRFHPIYQLNEIPSTQIKTLEKAYETARAVGLNYVYIGNVSGHRYENTYCPNCNTLLIKRFSFEILRWHLTRYKICPECGQRIDIKGKFHPSGFSYPHAII